MNFIIFPYRDQYFHKKFGSIVRDLMILQCLDCSEKVRRIVVVNRPVSLYERIWNKPFNCCANGFKKVKFFDCTSFDLFGPLGHRRWTEKCYGTYLEKIKKFAGFPKGEKNVLLDFTPIAKLDYSLFSDHILWYDLIDNFTKHNAYSSADKVLVEEKYRLIDDMADIITGVTGKALSGFSNINKLTIPNGILKRTNSVVDNHSPFTFGFLGFVTNKLDVSLIRTLVEGGIFSVAIYGQVYDKSIEKQLKTLPNVEIFGKFTKDDMGRIMSTFSIGLIPYLKEKSHDESPLKLYQYLDFGKPVIMTQQFDNFQSEYVFTCGQGDVKEAITFSKKMLKQKDALRERFVSTVRSQLSNDILWESKINNILNVLEKY